MKNTIEIRDPIHGAIVISRSERRVIESRVFQRLRYIKQLGLADFAFPGATHTRYSHSLGAMFFASKIFDHLFAASSLSCEELSHFKQCVRLAALLHDIGHPPLSHTTEMVMPDLERAGTKDTLPRRATHEDYTERLLLYSELASIIEEEFKSYGLSPMMIASLLQKKPEHQYFVRGNVDYGPLLSQIISSEIDADRMDYLLRDSLFCGVKYGTFDHEWLISNLTIGEASGKAYLGLNARAIFAFEDFLLSRYHMFASVYLHHTPVVMEKMLARYFAECGDEFSLPSDLDAYIALNDMDLWQALRKSQNEWAFRIVSSAPFVMIKECHSGYGRADLCRSDIEEKARGLLACGIDVILTHSSSSLSGKVVDKHPLFVVSDGGDLVPLEEYSLVFSRYQVPAIMTRIFVDNNDRDRALRILENG